MIWIRKWTTPFTTSMPSTILFYPTRLFTHKFLILHHSLIALHSSGSWATTALLWNFNQTRWTLPNMACLFTTMHATMKQLATYFRAGRYRIQTTLAFILQPCFPTTAFPFPSCYQIQFSMGFDLALCFPSTKHCTDKCMQWQLRGVDSFNFVIITTSTIIFMPCFFFFLFQLKEALFLIHFSIVFC